MTNEAITALQAQPNPTRDNQGDDDQPNRGSIWSNPQQHTHDQYSGRSRCQHHEQDTSIMIQTHSRPYRFRRRYNADRLKPSARAASLTLPYRSIAFLTKNDSTSSKLISSIRVGELFNGRSAKSETATRSPCAIKTARSTA